ncbi:hypothetical protein I4F81_002215 [Pyropia yezoensis]|uniref:Uncharacterized protein n=1 Tax=Pyropia yezoensis TaxID=2788 RepID=A0ACC3BNT1_PYRYE|nr:hypothetical protein I4F81_002215 [Neopyropia yezoensis]
MGSPSAAFVPPLALDVQQGRPAVPCRGSGGGGPTAATAGRAVRIPPPMAVARPPSTPTPSPLSLPYTPPPGGRETALDAAAARTLATLRVDLPAQYDAPLDWSIYAPSIVFDDPVTVLRGRLPYRGMINTLRVAAAVATREATFEVRAADRVSPSLLRTVWVTRVVLRWGGGRAVELSGVDYFHLDADGRVTRHESQWDDEPAAVWAKLRGK